MPDEDPWRFVTLGQYQRAIDLYRLLPQEHITSITLANRAAAYLCVRDYQAASRDYASLIQKDPHSARGYSGLAICHWCQGQPQEAVALWRQGLQSIYSDAAGVNIPARLLYAGVRLRNANLIREARDHLRNRARRKTVTTWPGAIAPYLLGKLSDVDFNQAARAGVTTEALLERHFCQYHFYRGVAGASRNDHATFEQGMRACAQSSNGYLEHEYYLAIWEVEQEFPKKLF